MNNTQYKNVICNIKHNTLPYQTDDVVKLPSDAPVNAVTINNALQQLRDNDLYNEQNLMNLSAYSVGPKPYDESSIATATDGYKVWSIDPSTNDVQIMHKTELPIQKSLVKTTLPTAIKSVNFIFNYGNVIFIGTNAGLYVSSDTGKTFTLINSTNTQQFVDYYSTDFITLLASTDCVYALTLNDDNINGTPISDRFKLIRLNKNALSDVNCVIIHPQDNIVYVGTKTSIQQGKLISIRDIQLNDRAIQFTVCQMFNVLTDNIPIPVDNANDFEIIDIYHNIKNTTKTFNTINASNNIYVTTNDGLYHSELKRQLIDFIQLPNVTNCTCMCVYKNTIWVGTYDNHIVSLANGQILTLDEPPMSFVIMHNNLYIQTLHRIYEYNENSNAPTCILNTDAAITRFYITPTQYATDTGKHDVIFVISGKKLSYYINVDGSIIQNDVISLEHNENDFIDICICDNHIYALTANALLLFNIDGCVNINSTVPAQADVFNNITDNIRKLVYDKTTNITYAITGNYVYDITNTNTRIQFQSSVIDFIVLHNCGIYKFAALLANGMIKLMTSLAVSVDYSSSPIPGAKHLFQTKDLFGVIATNNIHYIPKSKILNEFITLSIEFNNAEALENTEQVYIQTIDNTISVYQQCLEQYFDNCPIQQFPRNADDGNLLSPVLKDVAFDSIDAFIITTDKGVFAQRAEYTFDDGINTWSFKEPIQIAPAAIARTVNHVQIFNNSLLFFGNDLSVLDLEYDNESTTRQYKYEQNQFSTSARRIDLNVSFTSCDSAIAFNSANHTNLLIATNTGLISAQNDAPIYTQNYNVSAIADTVYAGSQCTYYNNVNSPIYVNKNTKPLKLDGAVFNTTAYAYADFQPLSDITAASDPNSIPNCVIATDIGLLSVNQQAQSFDVENILTPDNGIVKTICSYKFSFNDELSIPTKECTYCFTDHDLYRLYFQYRTAEQIEKGKIPVEPSKEQLISSKLPLTVYLDDYCINTAIPVNAIISAMVPEEYGTSIPILAFATNGLASKCLIVTDEPEFGGLYVVEKTQDLTYDIKSAITVMHASQHYIYTLDSQNKLRSYVFNNEVKQDWLENEQYELPGQTVLSLCTDDDGNAYAVIPDKVINLTTKHTVYDKSDFIGIDINTFTGLLITHGKTTLKLLDNASSKHALDVQIMPGISNGHVIDNSFTYSSLTQIDDMFFTIRQNKTTHKKTIAYSTDNGHSFNDINFGGSPNKMICYADNFNPAIICIEVAIGDNNTLCEISFNKTTHRATIVETDDSIHVQALFNGKSFKTFETAWYAYATTNSLYEFHTIVLHKNANNTVALKYVSDGNIVLREASEQSIHINGLRAIQHITNIPYDDRLIAIADTTIDTNVFEIPNSTTTPIKVLDKITHVDYVCFDGDNWFALSDGKIQHNVNGQWQPFTVKSQSTNALSMTKLIDGQTVYSTDHGCYQIKFDTLIQLVIHEIKPLDATHLIDSQSIIPGTYTKLLKNNLDSIGIISEYAANDKHVWVYNGIWDTDLTKAVYELQLGPLNPGVAKNPEYTSRLQFDKVLFSDNKLNANKVLVTSNDQLYDASQRTTLIEYPYNDHLNSATIENFIWYNGVYYVMVNESGINRMYTYHEPSDCTVFIRQPSSENCKYYKIYNDNAGKMIIPSNVSLQVFDYQTGFVIRSGTLKSLDPVVSHYAFSDTNYGYLIASHATIYRSLNDNVKKWNVFLQLPESVGQITDICAKNQYEYLIATANGGLYATKYEYTLSDDIKKLSEYDIIQIYNRQQTLLSAELIDAISAHIDEWHDNGSSLVDKINTQLLSVAFDGLDAPDWYKTELGPDNIISAVSNDIVFEMLMEDTAQGDVAVEYVNFLNYDESRTEQVWDEIPGVSYISKRWMSGITELYIYIPTTNTYYINHIPGSPNNLVGDNPINHQNLNGFGQDKSTFSAKINERYTKFRVKITDSIWSANKLIGIHANGNSLPLKIYKDQTYQQIEKDVSTMFQSFIEPTMYINNSMYHNLDEGVWTFEFSCFGSDAQAIKLTFIDSDNQVTNNRFKVVFDPNGAPIGTMTPQTFSIGRSYKLKGNTFRYPNDENIFIGWSLTPHSANDDIPPNEFYENRAIFQRNEGEINRGDTITLYACWISYQFTEADTTFTLQPTVGQTIYVDHADIIEDTKLGKKVAINWRD